MKKPTVRQFVRLELKGVFQAFLGPWWKTTAGVAIVFALWLLLRDAPGTAAHGGPVTRALASLAVGLYYGAFLGLAVGAFCALWRLFGPSLLAVLVVAPVLALGVVWLFRGGLASSATEFLDAVLASARREGLAHTAKAAEGMKVGCGGAEVLVLFLVLVSPFLLADAARILLDGAVLWEFLEFAGWMAAALGAAILAALLFASPVLLFALVRRARRRFTAGTT